MVVNDVVLVEIKIAPQYDKRDQAQPVECAKSDRSEDWHSPEFRPVQGRIQTTHLLNLCLIGVHPWLEKAEMISSG